MDSPDRTSTPSARVPPHATSLTTAQLTERAHVASVAMGVAEIARTLGVGRPLVRRLLASGELPVHVTGNRMVVLRCDVANWIRIDDRPPSEATK